MAKKSFVLTDIASDVHIAATAYGPADIASAAKS